MRFSGMKTLSPGAGRWGPCTSLRAVLPGSFQMVSQKKPWRNAMLSMPSLSLATYWPDPTGPR